MISRRKLLLVVGLGAFAPAFPLLAQQPKVARIGFLSASIRPTLSESVASFMQGMRDLGYVEGKNLVIEWRFAEGKYERLPALAAELVQLRPDVIVTGTTPGTLALMKATSTIPVVMTAISDPVGSGIVKSLARPGGNVTGMSITTVDVSPKLVELLQIIIPKVSRVAFVMNPGTLFHSAVLKSIQAAARSKGVQVLVLEAANATEIERGFDRMKQDRVNAVIFPSDTFYAAQGRQIAELAVKLRVATAFVDSRNVVAGGLVSYGPIVADSSRRAATYVDKILKGAKPSELPIEQPTTFRLAINRKTANALGLKVPQEILGRADEVIE